MLCCDYRLTRTDPFVEYALWAGNSMQKCGWTVATCKAAKAKGPSQAGRAFCARENQVRTRSLDAEGGATAAGRLDLWIFKLEASCFQSLDVVHRATIQVHQRSSIHKNL